MAGIILFRNFNCSR